jgi:glycine dehydrogenase subunit 1
MALASTVYLSMMGRQGLRKVAELCYQKAQYAAKEIDALEGYSLWNKGNFFHEFVISCPRPVDEINEQLLDYDIVGGYDLGTVYPDLANHMLLAMTELNRVDQIDALVEALKEVGHD